MRSCCNDAVRAAAERLDGEGCTSRPVLANQRRKEAERQWWWRRAEEYPAARGAFAGVERQMEAQLLASFRLLYRALRSAAAACDPPKRQSARGGIPLCLAGEGPAVGGPATKESVC